MDGNRRWATARNLPKTDGHKAGLDTVVKTIQWCNEVGIEDVAFYVFSTENWKRTKGEIDALMKLLEYILTDKRGDILTQEVRVRFVGDMSKIPKRLQVLVAEMELETKKHKKTAWVCLSYGGRLEIAEAANEVVGKVTEKKLARELWTADMPDLDLIIRTGGNHRLSNFLLWKASYAELYFTKTPWPAFSKRHLRTALEWYEKNIQVNKGR